MNEALGLVLEGSTLGALLVIVAELTVILRRLREGEQRFSALERAVDLVVARQHRIARRLGVVEAESGIIPPPTETSGPHPIIPR